MSRAICATLALSLSAVPALAGQGTSADPKAFLRAGTDGYYVALVLDPPAAPGTPPSRVLASVYRSGKLLTQTVRAGDEHGAAFGIPIGDPTAFGGDGRGLLVAVSSYPTSDPARPGAFAIPVGLEVQASVNPANLSCDPSALAMQIASNPNRDPTPYEAARLLLIHEYVPRTSTNSRDGAAIGAWRPQADDQVRRRISTANARHRVLRAAARSQSGDV